MAESSQARIGIADAKFWRDEKIVSSYHGFERVTAKPGRIMLSQSGLLSNKIGDESLRILDNACGTGIIASLLYTDSNLSERGLEVICGDLSPTMIESVNKRIEKEGWKGASARVIDAQDTKLESDSLTDIYTNFAIFAFPDPEASIRECFRTLRSGGRMGFTTWGFLGWVEPVQLAFAEMGVPPVPDMMALFSQNGLWHEPEWVKQHLAQIGFADIKTEIVDYTTSMGDTKAYARDLTTAMAMFTTQWPQELRKNKEPLLTPTLEKVLDGMFGVGGTCEMRMVAHVVTARK